MELNFYYNFVVKQVKNGTKLKNTIIDIGTKLYAKSQ